MLPLYIVIQDSTLVSKRTNPGDLMNRLCKFVNMRRGDGMLLQLEGTCTSSACRAVRLGRLVYGSLARHVQHMSLTGSLGTDAATLTSLLLTIAYRSSPAIIEKSSRIHTHPCSHNMKV